MKVKFNIAYVGCPDGINPTLFAAGEEADMPIDMAQVLVADGRAAAVSQVREAPENKMLDGAPETRASDAPPEDKPAKGKGKKGA